MLDRKNAYDFQRPNIFSEEVETVARFLSINTCRSVTDIVVPSLGATALVLDADGTLYRINEEPTTEVIEWVLEANEYLEGEVIIVSNNKTVYPFNGIKQSTRQSWHDYKLLSLRNIKSVRNLRTTESMPTIFAATDSPSDILSNRIAGIPFLNQYLVQSLGAHPAQEIVREHIYPKIAKAGSRILSLADSV